jgi:beta-lactamase class A
VVDAINDIGRQAGMERTRLARKFLDTAAILRHHDNLSTPADMAHLLYTIERGAREDVATIVSSQHCRVMIEIMLRQTDRDGIPRGLPAGTTVANKTGWITGTRNDIAVVEPFGDAPWVLAIMTKDLTNYSAAYDAMHAIARAAYHAAAQ